MAGTGNGFSVSIFDLVTALSGAADLVSPAVANHHRRVTYIALAMGDALGLSAVELQQLALAAGMHDIGALSLKERLDILSFEVLTPERHAYLGYEFLKRFSLFEQEARIVRYHHTRWQGGEGSTVNGEAVPMLSHLLHLADRVDILIDKRRFVLSQVSSVLAKINEHRNTMFMPVLIDGLEKAAARESFWFDIVSPGIEKLLERMVLEPLTLDLEGFQELARLLSHIIDFKSPFTSSHSAGVAATAEALARLSGFSDEELLKVRIAGYLHDLGKLMVPAEVLEKPAALSGDESDLMRGHTYYTLRVLENIPDLKNIALWAASHHERMDGNGYPFHMAAAQLSPAARIMAVADVFTALTEDRPYRRGMDQRKALEVLQAMAADGKLEHSVVEMAREHFNEIDRVRIDAQQAAVAEYNAMLDRLNTFSTQVP